MEFFEMKRNTSNWSNFCILLSRAGLSASAGISCCIGQSNILRATRRNLLVLNVDWFFVR